MPRRRRRAGRAAAVLCEKLEEAIKTAEMMKTCRTCEQACTELLAAIG